jgi:hypothetical protein
VGSLWAYDYSSPIWEIISDPAGVISDLFFKNEQKLPKFIKPPPIKVHENTHNNATFDGTIKPKAFGKPFSPLEISSGLHDLRGLIKDAFGPGCEISARGYYLIDFGHGYSINYNSLRMPIFRGDEVIGEISLFRHNNEVLSCCWSCNTFVKLFNEYPDSEYVMLRGHGAKIAITPDNEIHTIIFSPYFYWVEHQETLFESSKTADNTFSKNAERIPV